MAFGLGAILSGIGKGASAAGKGIFSGLKKVPRLLGGEDEGPGATPQGLFDRFRTPDFNPNARSPMIANAQPQGPMIETQRGNDDVFTGRPSPLKPPNIRPKPLEYPSPMMRNADENAPLAPQPGSPTFRRKSPYEELRDAKVEYNQGYKPPTGLGDRLKRGIVPAITNALKGYATTGDAGGAIGGALGGFGGATLAPRQTYEAEFDQKIKPKILERQKAEREEGLFQDARRRAGLEDQYKQAQIQQEQRQTAGMPSAEEARMDRQSEVNLRNARAEAERRGTAVKSRINDGAGGIWEVITYPNGQEQWVGLSGEAEIKAEDRASREKIEANRETGRNTRASQSEAGKSARQKGGSGSGAKTSKTKARYASMTDVMEYAKANKKSRSQAIADFQNDGWKISR